MTGFQSYPTSNSPRGHVSIRFAGRATVTVPGWPARPGLCQLNEGAHSPMLISLSSVANPGIQDESVRARLIQGPSVKKQYVPLGGG